MEVDLLVDKDGLINKDMADFCLPGKRVRTARIYFLKKTHKTPSLVPRPKFPTAAGGLHHRHFPRSGDVIHPQVLGIWVWVRDYKTPMGIRSIVSGSNSPTEQLSECVDIWLQPLVCQLPSYVRDSTQFINVLEGLTFPPDCLLASIDVTSLYTNIIHWGDGIECSVSALQHLYGTDPDQPPPEVIGDVILTHNVIEFEGQIYLHLQGWGPSVHQRMPAYSWDMWRRLCKPWLETRCFCGVGS